MDLFTHEKKKKKIDLSMWIWERWLFTRNSNLLIFDERYFGQLEKVWRNKKGKRIKESTI